MTALRKPGGLRLVVPEPTEVVQGYGECEARGCHREVWIKHPRAVVNGKLYGVCARCAGTNRQL